MARNEAAQEGLGIETDRTRAATEAATQAHDEQTEALDKLLAATLAQFNSALAYEQQTWRTKDAIKAYETAQLEAAFGTLTGEEATRKIAEAANDAASQFLSQAASAAKLAEDQAKASGATLTAAESARIQQQELQKVADTLAPNSPLRKQLETYITDLNTKIPKEVRTVLNVAINAWVESMNAGGGAGGGPVTKRSAGGGLARLPGAVFTPGGGGGKTAIDEEEQRLRRIQRELRSGVLAIGGRYEGKGDNVTINIAGSVTSEKDLLERIRKGLVESQRSGNKVVV